MKENSQKRGVSIEVVETTLRSLYGVLRAVATGQRTPLFVSWNITYRCNLACRYCGLHRLEGPEASTSEVLTLIETLARLGARFVSFSGGEPLIRRDFPSIVAGCRRNGLAVSIQTNGFHLRRLLPDLLGLSEVRVSLDGPREVQDAIRGVGSHDAALDAIFACRERSIPVLATAVMTGPSLDRLREFLDQAARLEIGVLFQPMDRRFAGDLPVDAPLYPTPESFRRAMDLLIAEKGRGSPVVANSLSGLRYMRGWPKPDPLPCRTGRLMCTVDADGRIFVCDMYPGYERLLVRPGDDLAATLRHLQLPEPCPRCITGAMSDLNLAAAGRLDAILGLASRLVKIAGARRAST